MATVRGSLVIRPEQERDLVWETLGRGTDVTERILWSDDRSRAALLHLRAGARLSDHTHEDEVHHVWVVSGSCTINSRYAGAGCYVFVPAATAHETKSGIEGCTLFYLVLPSHVP
jgi:mannose-6-phosphate isomerase-like protein (cupin superfamily)